MIDIRNNSFYRIINSIREFNNWINSKYHGPSPRFIKNNVLLRNAVTDELWIETGTYKGQTTLLLSENAKKVITIEPEVKLYKSAVKLFSKNNKVKIINGSSEDVFLELLPTLSGSLNFWLDGHFSAGETFKGNIDSPIVQELNAISLNLSHFENVLILIDDIRLCPSLGFANGYPSLDYLVDWAKCNGFTWNIEHDIFVLKRVR